MMVIFPLLTVVCEFILILIQVYATISPFSALLGQISILEGPFRRENFHGMLKRIIGGYSTPKFHGENFCGWLYNCEICESFLP